MAYANSFKWLKLEFADFGRADVGFEKYLKIFGKERCTFEKNSFEITSYLAQDIFAIARKFARFYKKLTFMLGRDIFL